MNAAIKPGASLKALTPQMALAIVVIAECYRDHGARSCIITSANDGTHKPRSLHYVGQALDLRTHGVSDVQTLRDRIQHSLGGEFDVVLEAIATDNEHIHVEYDPK